MPFRLAIVGSSFKIVYHLPAYCVAFHVNGNGSDVGVASPRVMRRSVMCRPWVTSGCPRVGRFATRNAATLSR